MKKYLLSILPFVSFLLCTLTPTHPWQEIDAFTSIVAKDQSIVVSTDKNKIIKSSDGGTTWQTVTDNIPPE